MSSPPAGSSPADANYIRGSGGGEIDPWRVAQIVVALCVVVLAVVVIAMTFGAASQNSTQTRLQDDGVPVTVTVTGCEGVSSGIAQAETYSLCRGDYSLGGREYNEVIGGTRAVHPEGQRLRAVTVPGHPTLLSTAHAVAEKVSPWTPYVTPMALAAVTIALGLFLIPVSGRRRRALSRPPAIF